MGCKEATHFLVAKKYRIVTLSAKGLMGFFIGGNGK